MNNRFITGITTGAIIGAAVGMMVMPGLDRNTKRKIRRTGKMARHMAGDMYSNMMRFMR